MATTDKRASRSGSARSERDNFRNTRRYLQATIAMNSSDDDETESRVNIRELFRVGKYLRPYQRALYGVIALVILMSCIMIALPMMTKILIDVAIPHKDVKLLVSIIAVCAMLVIVYELAMACRTLVITRVGQAVLKDLRRDIFTHLQTLSFDFFDSRPHGKILIRVVNYVNTLSDMLSSGLVNVFSDVFVLLFTLVAMFVIDWRLALWSLVFIPLLLLWVRVLQYWQKRAYRKLSHEQSNVNAYIHESIAGIKTTQTFAREQTQFTTFQYVQNRVRGSWMKAMYAQFLLWPGVAVIAVMTESFIYYAGITQFGGVSVSTGTLIAFIWYANNFWDPVINIGNFYNQLITCSAYLERIFAMLDVKPTIVDAQDAYDMPQIIGNVDINDVVFRYQPDGRAILNLLDLHVKPGMSVAFVGPTGAGKTTIVSLLSRFYDVTEGSITIDGHDIRNVTMASLRKQMGVMLQDTFIFSGTIRDNIRYGNLEASDEDIERAARAVHAHEFIMSLPKGYDTQVEERGSTLSSGQRQLIAFARVLLADPRIIILDEATSNIDTHTEEALQAGLNRLLKNRTSFIIAHRLSTIEHADLIALIDHGQIVECGSHDQLMQKKGAYYRLVESQYAMIQHDNTI